MSQNSRRLVKLLQNRPHAMGAEVGVFKGDTSAGLLRALPDLWTLICVDLWREDADFKRHCPNKQSRAFNASWPRIKTEFTAQVVAPFSDRVQVLQMPSIEAAKRVGPDVLDFVFLDGNHGYKYVREDILMWWPKVKIGGLVIGDDYRNKPTYGVIQAVQELFNGAHKNKGKIWYVLKTKEDLI